MNEQEAREIVARVDNMEEAVGRFNNLAQLGSQYWLAKGFLLGRESGIRESAEIPFKGSAHGGYYGMGPQSIKDAILALLPDGREKESQK